MSEDNKGKPKFELVRKHPAAAAAMSKAIHGPAQLSNFDITKKETYYNLNQSQMQEISDKAKDRLKENDNILDLFPDIAMGEQIITSAILSPKDMFTGTLIYGVRQTLLPSTIQGKVNEAIQSNLEGYYDILNELPEIIPSALFREGSYVSAVIPEAAIDAVINGQNYAAESHASLIGEIVGTDGKAKNVGFFLGPSIAPGKASALESFLSGTAPQANTSTYIALEAEMTVVKHDGSKRIETKEKLFNPGATTEGFLEITDNYQLIKLPKLLKAISDQRVKRALRTGTHTRPDHSASFNVKVSTESSVVGAKTAPIAGKTKKLSQAEFQQVVYKNTRPKSEIFTILPSKDHQKRHSVGRPLRMRIPSEAVIPVYPPGDPSNHRGYFVLVDMDGNWVTRSSIDTSAAGLQGMLNSGSASNSLTSIMLQKAKQNLTDSNSVSVVDNMLGIYSSIVEADMVNRLRNGVYGTEMEVGKDKEWDRIMLARALAGKMTRLVYIPNELITYYAYDYNSNGTGKSYLDKIKMMTSLRAVLLFTKTMAQMKNAINVTKVDMQLDPEDPDPQKTIEMATHDIARLRESYFPLGITNPVDLVNWIQRAGLMMTFKNHPGIPDTSFEFSTSNMQHQVPDGATDADLRKQTFMAFGLTPEQVDEGFGANFAATVLQQNAMFVKRISLLSDRTAKLLTSDVRNIVINDTIILQEIARVLTEAGEDVTKYLTDEQKDSFAEDSVKFITGFLDQIVDNIWVDLPKPNVVSQDVKGEDFQKMSDLLDKVLESFVSSEVFAGPFAGEFAGHADEIKKFWKHFLLREWVTEEGFLPQIAKIFKRDEDGKPENDVYDQMDAYGKEIMLSSMKFIERMKKAADAANKDLTNLDIPAGSPDSGGFGGGSSFGGGGFGGGSSSGGDGIFNFGGDDDAGGPAGLDGDLTEGATGASGATGTEETLDEPGATGEAGPDTGPGNNEDVLP